MQAIGASEKVFEYIDRKPEIPLSSGTLAPDRLCGRIEFNNVCFSYPGRPDTVVLKVTPLPSAVLISVWSGFVRNKG